METNQNEKENWSYDDTSFSGYPLIRNQTGRCICEVYGEEITDQEQIELAALISAAPEMLAVLIQVKPYIASLGGEQGKQFKNVLQKIRNVIKKACNENL